MNRTLRIYGPILGTGEEMRKLKSEQSWKGFYKYLSTLTYGNMEKWLNQNILDPDFIKETSNFRTPSFIRWVGEKINYYFMYKFLNAIVKDPKRQEQIFKRLKADGVRNTFQIVTWAKDGDEFVTKHFAPEELKAIYNIIL